MARFHLARDEFEAGDAALRAAIQLAPAVERLHVLLARSCARQGKFRDAEALLRQSLTLTHPEPVRDALAEVLLYQKKDAEAIRYLTGSRDTTLPREYRRWMLLGVAYQRSGRMADAARAFRQGERLVEGEVARTPRSGVERAYLAYFLAKQGRRERAEMEADQALRMSRESESLRMSALAFDAMGKVDLARDVLQRASPAARADLSRWPESAGLVH